MQQAFEHKAFFTRLHHFVLTSDAFVVVPGGIGTVLQAHDDLAAHPGEACWTDSLILVGKMWADLVEWAKTHLVTTQLPLASAADMDIPSCVNTGDEAIALIREHWEIWRAKQN